jgi:hypothetical protein
MVQVMGILEVLAGLKLQTTAEVPVDAERECSLPSHLYVLHEEESCRPTGAWTAG